MLSCNRDVLLLVFGHCSLRDVGALSRVCRRLQTVIAAAGNGLYQKTPRPRQCAKMSARPDFSVLVWTTKPGRFIGADTVAHRAAGRIGVTRQNRKENANKRRDYLMYEVCFSHRLSEVRHTKVGYRFLVWSLLVLSGANLAGRLPPFSIMKRRMCRKLTAAPKSRSKQKAKSASRG